LAYLQDACRPPDIVEQQQALATSVSTLKAASSKCSGLMESDTSKRDNTIINRGVYEQETNIQKLSAGI